MLELTNKPAGEMQNPRIYMICPRTIWVPDPNSFDQGNQKNVSFSCGRMAAHVAHASGTLAQLGIDTINIDLIILQVPTSVDLRETAEWIRGINGRYYEYRDPDFSFTASVIAMHPVEKDDPAIARLRFIPSWSCACDTPKKLPKQIPPEANDRNPARLFVVPKKEGFCPECNAPVAYCPQGQYCTREGCNWAY